MTAPVRRFTAPDGTEYAVHDVVSMFYVQHHVRAHRDQTTEREAYNALYIVFEPRTPDVAQWRMSTNVVGERSHLEALPERTASTTAAFWDLLADSWNLVTERESA